MATPVLQLVRPTGRGRQPHAVEEAADLRMELRACGQEMRSLGLRIQYAIRSERADVAWQVAGRLMALGERYAEPEGGPDAA